MPCFKCIVNKILRRILKKTGIIVYVIWGCSGLDGGGWSRIASREVPTS